MAAAAQISIDQPWLGTLPNLVRVERSTGLPQVLAGLSDLKPVVQGTAQQYELADVPYFLDRPQRVRGVPHLLLVYTGPSRQLAGGVLLVEFYGFFLSIDVKGRRSVFAPEALRAEIASIAAQFLIERGARFLSLDFEAGPDQNRSRHRATTEQYETAIARRRIETGRHRGYDWSLHSESMQSHMPLSRDFDATLAQLGHKARKNLRRYQRLAVRDLGACFEPNAVPSEADFLELAGSSHYPVRTEAARWRFRSFSLYRNTFLYGLQDRSGRWLSLAGCRRNGPLVEIDWQMNRKGFEFYSLVTALRSSLIRHEGSRGTTALATEGGTLHQTSPGFPRTLVLNLAFEQRGSLAARAMRLLLPRLLPLHSLTTALGRPGRDWQPADLPA